MNRFRRLLATLATLLLLSSFLGTVSASSETANGVIEPVLWSRPDTLELYSVFTAETERSTGRASTASHTFTAKATTAKLTIENDGVTELDVAVNGQRLNLNPFFENGKGTAAFDLTNLVQWGANQLEIESLGRPGATAKFKVEVPVFQAHLLHTNDIHAKIDPLPKMSAYVKAAKANDSSTWFVNAGDIFSGNPVSDLNKGVPMIEALNAMTTDVMAVGNHDFDHGPAATQARRSESNFPWLSANTHVVDPSATPIQQFEPYKILTNEYGHRIAFIGLTETEPSTAKKNTVGLRFQNPVEAAQQTVAAVRDQVNLVVLVSHNGHDFDQAMAPQLTGVDLILGAHSHTYLSEPEYVNDIPILQVGANGQYLSDLVVREDGAQVAVSAGAANGAYTVEVADLTEEDPVVREIVDRWNAQMGPILDAKIGETLTKLDDGAKSSRDVNIGNLITDAMRDYMGTEIAFTNNGGIRADIDKGDLTMRKVYTVLPFGNFVQAFRLTGAQIKQILEYSYTRDNRYSIDLQTSGLTYTIYRKPGSDQLDQIDMRVNGQPIDLNRTYTVAMADYIGTGGSGYPVPSMAAPYDMSSDTDAIVVGEFIKKLGTINYPSTEGRIKIRTTPTPIAVSRLNFYNSSTLLAEQDGQLVGLTNQAEVLVWAESTAFQFERSATAPKNFPKVNYPAGAPLALAAMQDVGEGKVVGLGALMVANGYRFAYQNPQWYTNLLDMLTGSTSGTVLFDEAHGQFYDEGGFADFTDFLRLKGYTARFTGKSSPITAESLAGVQVFVITSPGDGVGLYTAEELAVISDWVAGGGNLILANQTDYNNFSNPTELNTVAGAVGTVIRFNSDEVRDNTNKDGSNNYSPVTNEFNPAYPELLKVR